MRKPRDFDAALRALDDKAKLLRERKLAQLGDLVIATGADALPVDWRARCSPWLRARTRSRRRLGAEVAQRSFSDRRDAMLARLLGLRQARRRMAVARNRLLLSQARSHSSDWRMKRRERTRHLIELGGLVAKSGLIELTEDDRAVLYGLMISAAATLRGNEREQALTMWRRRGIRAFSEAKINADDG